MRTEESLQAKETCENKLGVFEEQKDKGCGYSRVLRKLPGSIGVRSLRAFQTLIKCVNVS